MGDQEAKCEAKSVVEIDELHGPLAPDTLPVQKNIKYPEPSTQVQAVNPDEALQTINF